MKVTLCGDARSHDEGTTLKALDSIAGCYGIAQDNCIGDCKWDEEVMNCFPALVDDDGESNDQTTSNAPTGSGRKDNRMDTLIGKPKEIEINTLLYGFNTGVLQTSLLTAAASTAKNLVAGTLFSTSTMQEGQSTLKEWLSSAVLHALVRDNYIQFKISKAYAPEPLSTYVGIALAFERDRLKTFLNSTLRPQVDPTPYPRF